MDENQLVEDFEEEIEETNEDEETSDEMSETSEDETDETTEQPKKKVNSFKKLRQELKDTKRKLAEATKKDEVKLKPSQELDARFFFIETPNAKDYKEDILKTIERFPNMTFEEAYKYIQAMKPKESVSKTDFNLKSKQKPADMKNMTDDEAVENLSPTDYLKYVRANGMKLR